MYRGYYQLPGYPDGGLGVAIPTQEDLNKRKVV